MDEESSRIRELEAELERVRTEAPLRLFDQIPDMVIFVDISGCILGFNDAALVQMGSETTGKVGEPLTELFEEKSGAALMELCLAGFSGVGDSEVRLQDGRTMSFSIRSVGSGMQFIMLRDVSQREQLEAELHFARRMASVGRLAGEVAHAINNPLSVIQGRLEMLRVLVDAPFEVRQRHLDIIEDHSRRVARIVRNLQVFAQPRTPEPEWLSLSTCVEHAVEAAGRRLERIKVRIQLSQDVVVYADPEQSALVWENILDTAANIAVPGGTVMVDAEVLGSGSVRVQVHIQGGSWSEEVLTELRSPYSGTRYRMDPGRGLALAISWGIVQEHGGWMNAANAPDGMSAFVEFMFPAPVEEPLDAGVAFGPRTLDFLVVDDDPVMGETLSWMISTYGHRAVVVVSAEEALERLSKEIFDGLITDHRLPGMDGENLLDIVRSDWPDMVGRTVLTSGLLHRPKDGQLYLQKPFSREQLGRVLKLIS